MCDVLPDESGIVLTSRELEEKYNTPMINNQNHSRHPELDSRHSVLDTESKTAKLRFKEFSEEWEEKKLENIE
jgi:hypothetical protein